MVLSLYRLCSIPCFSRRLRVIPTHKASDILYVGDEAGKEIAIKKIKKSTPLPVTPMVVSMDLGVLVGKASASHD